jgi:DnaJ-class molecular chaperone
MTRIRYQDVYPEIVCDKCGGPGFLGNGLIVNPCRNCNGFGVLIEDGPYRHPVNSHAYRKMMNRAETYKEHFDRLESYERLQGDWR